MAQTTAEINAEKDRVMAQVELARAQATLESERESRDITAAAARLEAQKKAADAAAGAIGTGFGGSGPPALSDTALQAPFLTLRGRAMDLAARGIARRTRAAMEDGASCPPTPTPAPTVAQRTLGPVLVVTGPLQGDLGAWSTYVLNVSLIEVEMDAAMKAANAARGAPGPDPFSVLAGLTAIGSSVRAVGGLLDYAKTDYAFTGAGDEAPAEELASALTGALLSHCIGVVRPGALTPASLSKTDVFVRELQGLSIAALHARADAASLETRAARVRAGDRKAALTAAAAQLKAAATRIDTLIGSLQPGADGKGGLAPLLAQRRLAEEIARATFTLSVSGRVAFTGRSKRSLVASIFGPPVDVGAAANISYSLVDAASAVRMSGVERVYLGPHAIDRAALDLTEIAGAPRGARERHSPP